MLKISNAIQPKTEILNALATYQKEIEDLATFEAKSKKAKDLFSIRNKKGNSVFDAIKVSLLQISPGIERCIYCEDSKCDEVEHIHPKDLYPHFCFLWMNYVYACGTCNGPKNNQFAVFRHDNGFYTAQKNKGAEMAQLNRMIENLKRESHPTVWKEMQRQYIDNSLKDSELRNYFLQSPEALTW